MTTKQTFPSVNMEALSNGLIRLEDETCIDGLVAYSGERDRRFRPIVTGCTV